MSAISLGYIRNPRADLVWFVALPFIAIALALFFHTSLPYMAQVSIAVWITVPHLYAGWVRGYGLEEDWSRWKERLIFGPILLIPSVFIGLAFVPVTFTIVALLWDHQHSVMQQHGFARIYDFKADTGGPSMGRLDFWLAMFLYGNLLLTSPLWSELWIAELYRWDLALRSETILQIQGASWTLTGGYVLVYLGYLVANGARGYKINPMKYLFLLSSYTLWYFVARQDSFLVYLVAHRIMHGVQYILMVYWYVERKAEKTGRTPRLLRKLSLPRFLLLGAVYTVVFHLATGFGLADFSFGLVSALQADDILHFTAEKATGLWAAGAISATTICHYYLDSYIWKVREPQIQEGL